ncbi:hypothetical protein EN866_19560 [Mesorhizobium sp. M2D.F.Ca.ET.223.01.1.1]|uniref:hypothetical protein n=1 Tax=unclassified Mesorhizobium TaxID=325217 RepID=UPI000FCB735B|nr:MULTISPECIES: hypothetical protein [unclassified Mesorhizobium]TGP89359.1 hypothetical protein EN864_19570 [bacterium M00.F.Ca.ET.221.01.1.1]TGP94732.1 hypothetical protein EN865_15440 [bacterium M00.F.Ca.ET.222.01.1.1]RVD58854.1 hypothetical protein EN783_14555 [Mesorhizobium sp. M2D.F.Ca.ET.140.01.1.1]TGP27883.1 hypothetical protein EN875_033040 [Mesorhizobium sp. M2D.F.Ca.ET.232.01.1.1]TGP75900.1 hypothetical protein EN867_15440 [Mesorhizobium sp. M2D.F.Ca.ET.224.01.1.1]
MKSLILATAALVGLAGMANAQAYGSGVDGQSVFRVSGTQPVTVTAVAVTSGKLASDTRVVRLSCTQDCHFKLGNASPTVVTINDSILFGGATEYFKVKATGPNYLGLLRDSTDGKAYIDEMVP